MAAAPLDALIDQLVSLSGELRRAELAPEDAAALVEECASVAAQASAELDRSLRAADAVPASAGQLALEP